MTEKKVYKPELISESSSDLSTEVKAYNPKLFSELKNGKGLIRVELDKDVVIQRISHDLYSEWQSGIRELLNNEVRACNIANKEHSQNSYIEITLDTVNKKIIIHGINSLGIDSETFLKVLRVLGVSDNFNGSEIGQFGFGFASYTTLTDSIIVETYSLLSKEKYTVVGKSGIGFDILPQPDLDKYGTRITIVYEELQKEGISDKRIYDAIIYYAQYKQIPIYLILPYPITEKSSYLHNDNEQKVISESGKFLISGKPFKDILFDKIIEDKNYNEADREKIKSMFLTVEKETEDFSFTGLIIMSDLLGDYRFSYRYSSYSNGDILLVNTPIDSEFDLPPYYDFIVNVKNERKYMPTVDRERLKTEAFESIKTQVTKIALEGLEKLLDFETWKEFLSKSNKWELYRHLIKCDELRNLIPHHKINMVELLKASVRYYCSSEVKPVHDTLESILTEKRLYEIYYSTTNIESVIRGVVSRYNAIVILTKNIGLMQRLGFKDIKEITGLDKEVGKTKISIHTSHIEAHGYCNPESVFRHTETKLLQDIIGDSHYWQIVIFDNGISEYLSLLSNTLTDYHVSQLKPTQYKWILNEIAQIPQVNKDYRHGIITFTDFITRIAQTSYQTSKGKMKAKDILSFNGPILLHNTEIKDTINYVKALPLSYIENNVNWEAHQITREKQTLTDYLYIIVNNNEEFELKAYFTYHQKRFMDFKETFKREFESLRGYCNDCGIGTDSYHANKTYGNLAFYLKLRLGNRHKSLYELFLTLTHNLDKDVLNKIEELSKIFLKLAQSDLDKPQLKPHNSDKRLTQIEGFTVLLNKK